MIQIKYIMIIYLLFPYILMAEQSKSSWLKLHKLNQASQQQLQQIQRTHANQSGPLNTIDRRNSKQILGPNSLQESQRHNQIILNQRRRPTPTDLLSRKQELQQTQSNPANQNDLLNLKNRLNHKQISEQTNLQESQRRKQIMLNQRRRLTATDWQDRLKANTQHQRFRVEQRNQLNRFRIQQRLRR